MQAGGPGSDDADGIGPSPGGGVVVSGGFSNTIRFDATRALTSASPLDDVFAAAYDGSGRVLWAQRLGGPGIDHAFDSDVDGAGATLATGTFAGTVAFGPFALTSRGGTLPAYGDAFLLKLNPSGAPRWVRQIGGTGSDGGDEVAVGPGGDAFVIGDSDGATRFSPRVELPATGGRDAWVARYRPQGRLAWARSLGGAGEQQSHGVSADREGNTLVTGEHQGETRFGNVVLGSEGGRPDIFVAKVDRRGRVRWAQRFGGPGVDLGRGVDADAEGHVYVSGEFSGTIHVGATTLTSAGGRDSFVAKLGRGGRVLWAVRMGGPGDEVGPELEVDARGAVHLAGSFAGQARFGDRTLTAPGLRAAFVARLTSRGRFAWVAQSGAGPYTTLGELALGPGRVSVLGRFAASATLGRFALPGAGRTDAFVAQLPTRWDRHEARLATARPSARRRTVARHMRLIVARCEVRYSGRLNAVLPEALRLLMLKADGSVMVHADTGGFKPQNWMTPPTVIEEEGEPLGRIVVRKRAGASEDRLDIAIAEVLSDVRHDMGEAAALEKDGVERDLQEALAAAPGWCGEGFRLVRREWPTDIGPVDLMCRDGEDGWIAVEIKRVATIDAVEQLSRYLERIRVDPAMSACRGVLAAQHVKPQALVLAQARGIACVEIDLSVLRGERAPDLTLFAA